MEISSIISNLQTATVKTIGKYPQQAIQPKTTNETAKTTSKNKEICDKADISNEALALLKNECVTTNVKQTMSKTNVCNNTSKTNNKNECLYKKAIKGYSAISRTKI